MSAALGTLVARRAATSRRPLARGLGRLSCGSVVPRVGACGCRLSGEAVGRRSLVSAGPGGGIAGTNGARVSPILGLRTSDLLGGLGVGDAALADRLGQLLGSLAVVVLRRLRFGPPRCHPASLAGVGPGSIVPRGGASGVRDGRLVAAVAAGVSFDGTEPAEVFESSIVFLSHTSTAWGLVSTTSRLRPPSTESDRARRQAARAVRRRGQSIGEYGEPERRAGRRAGMPAGRARSVASPARSWRCRRSSERRWWFRSGTTLESCGRTSSALRFPLRSRSSVSDAASISARVAVVLFVEAGAAPAPTCTT